MSDTAVGVWTLTARWILPIGQDPLEHGTVTVRGERIETVLPHGQRTADIDLGNSAILPGLVNAHTHLDLSGLRGLVPPAADFTRWLRSVVSHRRTRSPEQVEADVRAGLEECLQSGTTLIGDISAAGCSWNLLVSSSVRAIVFHELLGLPSDRAAAAANSARDWLDRHLATETCRPGLSPHAPYSVRPRSSATPLHWPLPGDCP
jgi:cytosine/adenosine deaminase-related metal-dependent hydrolase